MRDGSKAEVINPTGTSSHVYLYLTTIEKSWSPTGELPVAARWLGIQPGIRVVILAGTGKNFCAGIDLAAVAADLLQENSCPARTRLKLLGTIKYAPQLFSQSF